MGLKLAAERELGQVKIRPGMHEDDVTCRMGGDSLQQAAGAVHNAPQCFYSSWLWVSTGFLRFCPNLAAQPSRQRSTSSIVLQWNLGELTTSCVSLSFRCPEEAAKPELASDDDIPDAGEIDDGDSDSDMSALEDEDSDSGSSEGILEEEMVRPHS